MSADAAGSDASQASMEVVIEQEQSTVQIVDNGNVNVGQSFSQSKNSGFDGKNEPSQGEANNVSDPNIPKDAADEWPTTNQIHSFYFVKYRLYEDPNLRAKFDQVDKELQKKMQQRNRIIQDLKAKKTERAQVIEQLKSLNAEKRQYNMVMDEKRSEMKPLQEALGSLRGPNNPSRERGIGICSSEEELNDLIRSLHYRMQHESISLTEEKQLLREIKQLEGTRDGVIANAAMRAKIQDSLGQKETIQEQVKLIGTDLDGVRKDRQAVGAKIKYLEDQFGALKDEINTLEEDLKLVDDKKREILESLDQLRGHRDLLNKPFHEYRRLMSDARTLAAAKDTKALEELCHASVDNFISLWSSSKAFRDDYEKRILLSLDNRQLSRDGRMRNPDEKPLVLVEASVPASTENPKAMKPLKEDLKPPGNEEKSPSQKESKKKPIEQPITVSDRVAVVAKEDEEDDFFVVEKLPVPTEKEIDPAKLKELKREEEMAKQRQALERKKKLAEKSAAKAAARAKKEAERKQKEREKKLKKKDAPDNQEELTRTEEEVAEPENPDKVESSVPEARVPAKPKEQKETTIRARNRTRGRDSLPKAILKRKKSNNYWVWAAPAAAIVVVLAGLLYNYL